MTFSLAGDALGGEGPNGFKCALIGEWENELILGLNNVNIGEFELYDLGIVRLNRGAE